MRATRSTDADVRDADADGQPTTALEQWLDELERLDHVLAAQSDYLDAVESGASVAPPTPFVGTPGLPEMPATLTPYARDLLARNDVVTRRAVALSAQLRPRQQRPLHVPTPLRGSRFEGRA